MNKESTWKKMKKGLDKYYYENNMVMSIFDALWMMIVSLGQLLFLFSIAILGLEISIHYLDREPRLLFLIALFFFVLNYKMYTPSLRYTDKNEK